MSNSENQTDTQARSNPSSGVGALLKATRVRMGQDLRQVSQALRIRQLFLQAIEDGRFDELPGPTYALGFVRSYADFLGLDSEEVVRRFRAETSGIGGRNDLVFPTPAAEKRLPSGALVAAALAVGALVYGGWYAYSASNRPAAEAVPEVPDRLVGDAAQTKSGEENQDEENQDERTPAEPQAVDQPSTEAAKPDDIGPLEKVETKPAEKPETKAETKPEEKTEAKAPEAKPEETGPEAKALQAAQTKPNETPRPEPVKPAALAAVQPLPVPAPGRGMGGLAISAQPKPAGLQDAIQAPAAPSVPNSSPAKPSETASAQPVQTHPAAAPAPEAEAPRTAKVYGQTEGDVRLVLKAASDSWIQVRDEKGNLVATRLLKKDDTYRVPTGQGRLLLTTGDAGALSAFVDGILVTPSLGPSGSVRRDLVLDPDRIKAGNQ